jgi:hypothetical protein
MIADIDVCVKDENDLQRLFARFLKQGIIQARHRPESDHLFSLNLSSECVHFVIHFFCTFFKAIAQAISCSCQTSTCRIW